MVESFWVMRVSVMKPIWVGGELLLIRRVIQKDEHFIQGCVLDWPKIKEPLTIAGNPAWSPDGKSIAAAVHTAENGVHAQLVVIGADDGKQVRLGTTGWEFASLSWLPDGRGLLISALRYLGFRNATARLLCGEG